MVPDHDALKPSYQDQNERFGGLVELNGRELSWDGCVNVCVVTERHDQPSA